MQVPCVADFSEAIFQGHQEGLGYNFSHVCYWLLLPDMIASHSNMG